MDTDAEAYVTVDGDCVCNRQPETCMNLLCPCRRVSPMERISKLAAIIGASVEFVSE